MSLPTCTLSRPSRFRPPRARAVIALLGMLPLAGCGYDRMQELEDRVRAARTDVEAIVQRRIEVIPNLVEVAGRFGVMDERLLGSVNGARAQLVSAARSGDLPTLRSAHLRLSHELHRLMRRSEAIPALDRDPAFEIVRSQLTETRTALEAARSEYNRAVSAYNRYIGEFPHVMTARIVRAHPMQTLESWDVSSGDAVQSE